MLDSRKPERRLPNPRLTLEHEHSQSFVCPIDEGANGVQLLLAADDFRRHSVHDRDRGADKDNRSRLQLWPGYVAKPGATSGKERVEPGSRWAANVSGRSASLCGVDPNLTEEPREQCRCACIVVHLATAEAACHAGGRGFESRRSRSRTTWKRVVLSFRCDRSEAPPQTARKRYGRAGERTLAQARARYRTRIANASTVPDFPFNSSSRRSASGLSVATAS
jgi:hypothetical protein